MIGAKRSTTPSEVRKKNHSDDLRGNNCDHQHNKETTLPHTAASTLWCVPEKHDDFSHKVQCDGNQVTTLERRWLQRSARVSDASLVVPSDGPRVLAEQSLILQQQQPATQPTTKPTRNASSVEASRLTDRGSTAQHAWLSLRPKCRPTHYFDTPFAYPAAHHWRRHRSLSLCRRLAVPA